MDSLKIRLFSSIVLVILCVDFSRQEFGDWFSDNKDENVVDSGDSSSVNSSITQSLSTASTFSSTSTTASPETSPTSVPTRSSTVPSTPSTTPSTSPSTSPSTEPTTRRTRAPITPPITVPTQSTPQLITSSTPLRPITEESQELSSPKPKECLKIELNAKIVFNYKSKEGFDQQFEVIGGNSNGDLFQPDKCQRNQTLVIKYDLLDKTQLIIGITITDTNISIKSIRFEYPFNRLPDDFNKDNHSEEVRTCSSDKPIDRLSDKCLIAENKDLIHYSLKYKSDEQIYCKELPLIVLKNNNKTSIDILFKDLRLVVNEGQTNTDLTRSDEFCPIDTIDSNDNEFDAMFAGTTKIWVGVSYAVVGALIMFGFAFIYERFVRERLLYNPIEREDPEV